MNGHDQRRPVQKHWIDERTKMSRNVTIRNRFEKRDVYVSETCIVLPS